jgi:DNA replication protein DnaD
MCSVAHPDPTIQPVMLKEFSKKLKRVYGWSEEDFLERMHQLNTSEDGTEDLKPMKWTDFIKVEHIHMTTNLSVLIYPLRSAYGRKGLRVQP